MVLYFNQLQDILKVIIEDFEGLLPHPFFPSGNEYETRHQI